MRIELEASKRVSSAQDNQLRELIVTAEEANKEVLRFKSKLAQVAGQWSFAEKKCDDSKKENVQLMQEIELLKQKIAQNEDKVQGLQSKLFELEKRLEVSVYYYFSFLFDIKYYLN